MTTQDEFGQDHVEPIFVWIRYMGACKDGYTGGESRMWRAQPGGLSCSNGAELSHCCLGLIHRISTHSLV